MFAANKILCPTDFSDGSLQALATAAELAVKFEGEVYLVHVLPPPPTTFEGDIEVMIPSYEQSSHAAVERRMREIAEPLTAKGLQTQIMVAEGDAADEIVRIARDERADLIVIATHGNTGWRHLAFGSVTEKVVRLAACPVLTIRIGAAAQDIAA